MPYSGQLPTDSDAKGTNHGVGDVNAATLGCCRIQTLRGRKLADSTALVNEFLLQSRGLRRKASIADPPDGTQRYWHRSLLPVVAIARATTEA